MASAPKSPWLLLTPVTGSTSQSASSAALPSKSSEIKGAVVVMEAPNTSQAASPPSLRVLPFTSNYFQSKIVKVTVGSDSDRVTFKVHESVLLGAPFFQRCLQPPFIEAAIEEVSLPEDSPAAFEQVLFWLYGGWTDIVVETGDESTRAVRTYVLADKLCLERLANNIVDMFQDYCRYDVVPPSALFEVSRYGEAAGKLKDMLLKQLEHDIKKSGWDNYVAQFPCILELWADISIVNAHELMRELASHGAASWDPSLSIETCRWHIHHLTPKLTRGCCSSLRRVADQEFSGDKFGFVKRQEALRAAERAPPTSTWQP